MRSQIGYVPQTGILFSGDINSNISYGAPGIDEAGIKEAAQIAQATEFIEDKPDKFESAIAQGVQTYQVGRNSVFQLQEQ